MTIIKTSSLRISLPYPSLITLKPPLGRSGRSVTFKALAVLSSSSLSDACSQLECNIQPEAIDTVVLKNHSQGDSQCTYLFNNMNCKRQSSGGSNGVQGIPWNPLKLSEGRIFFFVCIQLLLAYHTQLTCVELQLCVQNVG